MSKKRVKTDIGIVDPVACKKILTAAAEVAHVHEMPFSLFGPTLEALGRQMRAQHARRMADEGCSREQVDAYVNHMSCQPLDSLEDEA